MLVGFDSNADKDYFNVSIYDNEGLMIATDSVVFNSEGKVVSYPFTSEYVSPLTLDSASLLEAIDDDGRRVVQFRVKLRNLASETPVHLLWEAMGNIQRETTILTPQSPEALLEMPLVDNPLAIPTDWVAIAVDDKERVIAQTTFALVPE